MPCFDFQSDFIDITVLLQNNLIMLKLFVIILNCVGISDWSQHTRDVNTGFFNVKLITISLVVYIKPSGRIETISISTTNHK